MSNEPHESDDTNEDGRYHAAARARYQRDGEIEIDDNAIVSYACNHGPEQNAACHSGDPDGAYVQAWVWVSASEAEA